MTKTERRKLIAEWGEDNPFVREQLGLPPVESLSLDYEFHMRRDGAVVIRKPRKKR